MSPRRLDAAVVLGRLRLIGETLDQLRQLEHADVDLFTARPLDRAAAERLLQVLVDLAIDVNAHVVVASGGESPETGRESFIALGMVGALDVEFAATLAPSAGMRNILVHRYFDIRLNEVVKGVQFALEHFPNYVSAVAAYLDSQR